MSLLKYLAPTTVSAALGGATKTEVIDSLLDLVCASGKVTDRAAALDSVLKREHRMSTGMENGIAIPHGKTDAVEELVAAVGITKEGIDFASLDGVPCRIFIMTLSPSHGTGPHIQFLSEISELLRSEEMRLRLLSAGNPDAILEALADHG